MMLYKKLIRIILVVFLMLSVSCTGESSDERISRSSSPNFLVIVADDLGLTDLGFMGGEVETPIWIPWPNPV